MNRRKMISLRNKTYKMRLERRRRRLFGRNRIKLNSQVKEIVKETVKRIVKEEMIIKSQTRTKRNHGKDLDLDENIDQYQVPCIINLFHQVYHHKNIKNIYKKPVKHKDLKPNGSITETRERDHLLLDQNVQNKDIQDRDSKNQRRKRDKAIKPLKPKNK